uniref:Uncharacterized protein n=1 Tax=Tanacetum cinerariifolium TaxID=118510 RepID=A0A699HS29_TANCI|nr:hypothetical protein [Tanacetum cinerariifolium]
MSRFNLPEEIDKSVQAHFKNILPKDVLDFGKIKLQKVAKQSMSKYSTTPFDQGALNEYDQKDKLFKIMMKYKSYDIHPHHRALLEKEKKKRKQKDSESSKKDKIKLAPQTKTRESVEKNVLDAKDPSQADASAPKQDKSMWFKIVVVKRPESPDSEWHKEPTVDDAPK